MEKIYVGKLTMADRVSNVEVTEKTELRFENGERHFDEPFKLRQEYYVVEKSELDAYMARKEDLEKMNCTPVWDENKRLRDSIKQLEAENADLLGESNSKLTEENEALKDAIGKYYYGVRSAECELKAANEKLAVEIDGLNRRISHLKVILEHDENRMAALITENNKLRGTYNELNATVAKLRQDLAKYSGVQEVIDICTTCDQDCFVLWWTGRNGDEHKLEFKLVPNPMDETMCREMHIYDPTRS